MLWNEKERYENRGKTLKKQYSWKKITENKQQFDRSQFLFGKINQTSVAFELAIENEKFVRIKVQRLK